MSPASPKSVATFAALFVLTSLACEARSITIVRDFIAPGNTFPGGAGTAGSAGNENGGGSLQAIFNAAANYWEAALMDAHTVTIHYGWQSLAGSTLGVHSLLAQGGAPNRETEALIRLDNDLATSWFSDSTPYDSTEYGTYTSYSADLGGGSMNVGRVWTGATGSALGNYDLVSVVLHEIGHALGMSSANTSFTAENGDLDIDLTSPRPYAGAALPTISGAHLNLANANLWPSVSTSRRNHLSEADILANAQISQFSSLNLNPVPEPATLAVVGIGLAALAARRRRRAS